MSNLLIHDYLEQLPKSMQVARAKEAEAERVAQEDFERLAREAIEAAHTNYRVFKRFANHATVKRA